jgi:hypothetical protein
VIDIEDRAHPIDLVKMNSLVVEVGYKMIRRLVEEFVSEVDRIQLFDKVLHSNLKQEMQELILIDLETF